MRTASASLSTPASIARRAVSLNSICLLMNVLSDYVVEIQRMPPRKSPAGAGISGAGMSVLLGDDSQHVACRQDQVLLVVVLDLGAAVLAVDHGVALGDVQGNALFAILVPAAGANCDDGAFLRLLLGGVGDDQTRSGRSLGLIGLNEDLVLEWLDVHGHDGALHIVGVRSGVDPGPSRITSSY